MDPARHPITSWPANGLERLGHCPVCDSREIAIVHTDCRDVVFGAAGGLWEVCQCKACRSGFLDTRPTPDTIGQAYSVYYTHETRRWPAARQGWMKQALLDRIRGSYINVRYSRGRPSLGWLGRWMADRLPELRRSLDSTHRFLPYPAEVATPRLLDLGCGNGDFLKIASQAGWQTFGSDPDPAALKLAAELAFEVRAGGVDVWNDLNAHFDAISMNHVVEHLHDPVRDLRRCHDLLKPGGHLYIETPNFDACGRELYGPNWRGLEVPRHLVIFTWSSLRATLEACGFEIRREIRRDNFLKQARRSAKAEAGIFDYQDPGDAPLRMPTAAQIRAAQSDPDRTEWIGLLARKRTDANSSDPLY